MGEIKVKAILVVLFILYGLTSVWLLTSHTDTYSVAPAEIKFIPTKVTPRVQSVPTDVWPKNMGTSSI